MAGCVLSILLLATAPLRAREQKAAERPASPLPAEVASAFGRAASLYTDGAAHAAPFVQIYTPAGFTTARRESGTLWIQTPQRLRFEYDAPERKVFTYDAGEGRLFTPEDKQLTIQKLTPEERARLPIVFLSDPVELAREYAVSAEAAQAGATRVLLKPRAPRPELAWLRLSVDRDGRVSELSYEDAGGNRTEFRFEGWRKEKARPAADYRIAGPPGTRILQN
jgi:outer membrane lipoprotein carrier protein